MATTPAREGASARWLGDRAEAPKGSDQTTRGTGRPDPARVKRARRSRSTFDRGDPCHSTAKQRKMSLRCWPVADDTMSSRASAEDPAGTPRTARKENPGIASETNPARSRRDNGSLLTSVTAPDSGFRRGVLV